MAKNKRIIEIKIRIEMPKAEVRPHPQAIAEELRDYLEDVSERCGYGQAITTEAVEK